MKKYILISFLFHLIIFLGFKNYKQQGKEEIKKINNTTFIATISSPNPGSTILSPKENAKKDLTKPKPKKEEIKKEKIEKKEIKSKIESKKEEILESKQEIANSETQKNIEDIAQEEKDNETDLFQGSNFMADGDGGYIALSSAGIDYTILKEFEPSYPQQAEMLRYSQTVVVGVKFLVDLNGEVSKVEITKSHAKLGFDDEVKKAIKKWKFKPIYYHGKNIKVYFEKEFIFNRK